MIGSVVFSALSGILVSSLFVFLFVLFKSFKVTKLREKQASNVLVGILESYGEKSTISYVHMHDGNTTCIELVLAVCYIKSQDEDHDEIGEVNANTRMPLRVFRDMPDPHVRMLLTVDENMETGINRESLQVML